MLSRNALHGIFSWIFLHLLQPQKSPRLMIPQLGVEGVIGEQLPMAALLDDAALVENDEPIHGGYRRQPVGNCYNRLASISRYRLC